MNLNAVRVKQSIVNAPEGVRVPLAGYDPRFGDIAVRVRGFDNKDDLRIREQQAARANGATLSAEEMRANMNERLVGAILVGWDNVNDGPKNDPVPFSHEAAAAMLDDEDLFLFRNGVIRAADDVTNGRKGQEASDAGN